MLVIISAYLQRNAVLDVVCDRHWDSPLIVSLVATSLEAAVLTYVLIIYLGMINQTYELDSSSEQGFPKYVIV